MMKQRRSSLLVAVLIALSVILAGCGSESATGKVVLRLGHVFPENDPIALAINRFAESVEMKTGGSVTLEIYPAGQIGGERDTLEGLEIGTTDAWYGGAGVYNAMTPVGEFFVTPFMFDSVDEAVEAYNSELGRAIRERIDRETPTTLVGIWPRGPRHVTANKGFSSPAEMAGLRIRVPENPMFLETFHAVGASPTPLAFSEVFTALEQRTIDAQENPLALIKSSGFSKVQSHLTLTGHVIEPMAIAFSDSTWESLTDEQRRAIRAASDEVGEQFRHEVNADEEKLLSELEAEGMTVVKPDVAAFRQATASVRQTRGAALEDLYSLVGSGA